jgi:hypothetical protein
MLWYGHVTGQDTQSLSFHLSWFGLFWFFSRGNGSNHKTCRKTLTYGTHTHDTRDCPNDGSRSTTEYRSRARARNRGNH